MCKIQEPLQIDKFYKPKYEIRPKRSALEVQDIFKLYGDDYIARHKLNSINAKECNDCKNIEFAYNSCRNRNCPKCQGDEVPLEGTNDMIG